MSHTALIPNRILLSRFSNGKEKLTRLAIGYWIAIFSYVKPGDTVDEGEKYKSYRIPKADLKNKFGFTKASYYRDLLKVCKEIASFVFNVADNPVKDLVTENIKIINMSNATFIEVQISGKLLNMLNLSQGTDGFTTIQVNRFLSLKNEYARKMFLELSDKRWELETEREYSEQDIRELLSLEDKYSEFNNVLYYGLGTAKKELQKQINPEFFLTYKPIPGGHKGKYLGVTVKKCDPTKYLTVNELDMPHSYNKQYVNQALTAPELNKKLGYLQKTFHLEKYQAERLMQRILVEELSPIVDSVAKQINKHLSVPGTPKVDSPAKYFMKRVYERFGKNILAHDDDYYTALEQKKAEAGERLNKLISKAA